MIRSIIIVLLCILLFPSMGQNIYRPMVITAEKDTIEDIWIRTSAGKTNFRQVTYNKAGKKNTLTADEVYAYYTGEDLFISKPIYNRDQNHLIRYEVIGPLEIAFGKGKNLNMYAQLYGEDQIYPLVDYKSKLDSLFEALLYDYQDFRVSYKEKPVYNRNNLITMASYYNEFDSEEFLFEGFDQEPVFRIGPYAGVSVGYFKWDEHEGLVTIGIPAGVLMEIEYTRYFSFKLLTVHNYYRFEGPNDDIRLGKVSLEPYLALNRPISPDLTTSFGLGINAFINYKGKAYHPFGPIPNDLREFGGGYRASVDFKLFDKYVATLTYLSNDVRSNYGLIADPTRDRGRIHSFRLAFVYYLN